MEPKSARKGKKIGVGRKLGKEQEAEVFKLICTKRPWQQDFTLPYRDARRSLWDRDLVMQLIERKYGIKLSDGGVVNHLKRWGFPLTSEGGRAYDGCTKEIRNWLDEHYPAIQERAKAEDAKIFWVSNTAMVIADAVKVVRQQKLSMISAITNQRKIHWLVIRGQFSPEQQIKFMTALINVNKQKVFMIRDDLNFYAKRDVVDWLRERSKKIELFPPPEWKPADKRKVGTRGQRQGGSKQAK